MSKIQEAELNEEERKEAIMLQRETTIPFSTPKARPFKIEEVSEEMYCLRGKFYKEGLLIMGEVCSNPYNHPVCDKCGVNPKNVV